MCPLRYEGFVVKPLGNNDVKHRKRECIVRARPDLQPQVSLFGKHCASWIDHDDLRITIERLDYIETRFAVGA